jgi:hypothetical protein
MTSPTILCGCSRPVEPERVSLLNSRICAQCANLTQRNKPLPRGVMIWEGKTAPTIQILSQTQFDSHRYYNPYGKLTGRGSGLHRITKTTSCQ